MRFHEDWFIKSTVPQIAKIKDTVNNAIKNLNKEDLENLSTRGKFSKQYVLKDLYIVLKMLDH